MNTEIQALHHQLIQLHLQLSERLGITTDVEDAQALLREMDEVNFRVMMVGRLLFKELTRTISDSTNEVKAATEKLAGSLAEIEKLKKVVSAIGKLLTKVDEVVDKIKLL